MKEKILKRLAAIAGMCGGEVPPNAGAQVQALLEEGLNYNEVVGYMRCTEEICPHLAEDTALRRMVAIRMRH